mmetsp:Transcript_9670/g.14231  ORF Transcript_9670/g.14231 Transcript_9670/m.14231 type:complete len:486 (-) Transcript_9670:104-1561(-)
MAHQWNGGLLPLKRPREGDHERNLSKRRTTENESSNSKRIKCTINPSSPSSARHPPETGRHGGGHHQATTTSVSVLEMLKQATGSFFSQFRQAFEKIRQPESTGLFLLQIDTLKASLEHSTQRQSRLELELSLELELRRRSIENHRKITEENTALLLQVDTLKASLEQATQRQSQLELELSNGAQLRRLGHENHRQNAAQQTSGYTSANVSAATHRTTTDGRGCSNSSGVDSATLTIAADHSCQHQNERSCAVAPIINIPTESSRHAAVVPHPVPTSTYNNQEGDENLFPTKKSEVFDTQLESIREFRRKFGQVCVPKDYDARLHVLENKWRANYEKRQQRAWTGFMSDDRFNRLSAMNFIDAQPVYTNSSDSCDRKWKSMAMLLRIYNDKHRGDCAVPVSFDKKLHEWVLAQAELFVPGASKPSARMKEKILRRRSFLDEMDMRKPLRRAYIKLQNQRQEAAEKVPTADRHVYPPSESAHQATT